MNTMVYNNRGGEPDRRLGGQSRMSRMVVSPEVNHTKLDPRSKRVVLVGNPVVKLKDDDSSRSLQQRQADDASGLYMNDVRDQIDAPAATPRNVIDLTSKDDDAISNLKSQPVKAASNSWGWALGWLGDSSSRPASDTTGASEIIDLTSNHNPQTEQTSTQMSRSRSAPSSDSQWGYWFTWSTTPATETDPTAAESNTVDADNIDKKLDDDSCTEASAQQLFGDFEDLNSIPSVNDATVTEESLQSADFDGRDDGSSARHNLFEQKLEELVVNNKEARSSRSDQPTRKKIHSEGTLQTRRQLLIKELRTAISQFGRYDLRCANISAALGDVLDEAGEYEQAIKLHKDAVTIYTVKLGDNSEITIDAKVRLGSVLVNSREYDEALDSFWAVTSMRRALKGEKDPSVADGLSLMADCLKQNAEYQQAIKELKRALKIYRQTLGDSHAKVAKTVDDIASLYVTIGDFEKSAAILEEVVKLKAATQGMKSDAVAETLLTLAMTYECSEQFTQAMKTLKKAYKIYTEMAGYSSENATSTLNKIAMLYEATGDYHRASIAYLGFLRGRKIHLGEENLLVGETYCKLGHALRETGQYDKALKCMKEALPIFVGSGVELQDVEKIADIMSEMALIYKEKKHFSESARIFKQELSVRRKIGQPEFPLIARNLNNLGVIEYEMKNNSRALKYFVEALTICQEQGEHGMDCAEILFNTGLVFAAVRNRDRALEALTEALRLFTEHGCKENHPNVINANREISKLAMSSNR